MSKHTEGPWQARNMRGESYGEVRDSRGLWVARVHLRDGIGVLDGEAVANTHLIAAAPELLAALRRVGCMDAGSCGRDEPDGLCFTCAAVAKAEGLS